MVECAGVGQDGLAVFVFRVRLADGTKSERCPVPSGLTRGEARTYAAKMQKEEDVHGGLLAKKREKKRLRSASPDAVDVPEVETCDAWFKRYFPTKECGDAHRRITASIYQKWIHPVIGSKAMRTLTRDDLEDVRDTLDRALDAKTIRHSTARNAWGVLTGGLKTAYAGRDRALRVLETPIYFGVLPPKRGDSRQRPWLHPNEWTKFAGCADIPIPWRQACAIALYTALRPGELRALRWSDVDLTAKTISISKSFDEETGEDKAPKTAQSQRTIPILPTLFPLLAGLEGDPDDHVLPKDFPHEDTVAGQFRAYLEGAGVERVRLFADNATEEKIDFRSLRDTHATWLAILGVSDKVIQRRLGHASASTTDRYIKAAECFDPAGVGTPFPAFPPEVCPRVYPRKKKTPGKNQGSVVARDRFACWSTLFSRRFRCA